MLNIIVINTLSLLLLQSTNSFNNRCITLYAFFSSSLLICLISLYAADLEIPRICITSPTSKNFSFMPFHHLSFINLFWRFSMPVLLMSQPASLPEIISCNTARSCSRYSVRLGECLHSLDSYECHGKCLLDF